IAKRGEEIEIAVAVVVDPHRLPADAAELDAQLFRDVGERASLAVVAIDFRGGVRGREPDVEIGVAVVVVVAPGGSARLDVVRESDLRGDVRERAVVVHIQPIWPAAKADELIEIAVAVDVRPRVRLSAGSGEELRLDELELDRRTRRDLAAEG